MDGTRVRDCSGKPTGEGFVQGICAEDLQRKARPLAAAAWGHTQ